MDSSGLCERSATDVRWSHFPYGADIGIRGIGPTMESAFEQAACALFGAVTDLSAIEEHALVTVVCEAPTRALLLVEWLNALIYQAATRRMLFRRFEVRFENGELLGRAWGEHIEPARHQSAVEPKGATLIEPRVERRPKGAWLAQCVVDV